MPCHAQKIVATAFLLFFLFKNETKMYAASAFDCIVDVVSPSLFQQKRSLLVNPSRFRPESFSYFYQELGMGSFSSTFIRQKLTTLQLSKSNEDKKRELLEEEANVKVWESRRKYIRNTLRFAESTKNYRISNGFYDVNDSEMTDDEKKNADRKAALTITAFVAAAGAVILRVGGRAALISGLGIDFSNNNSEFKEQLDSLLSYVHDSGPFGPLLFILAWTVVKVLCFDAGGLVLAFASGVLFGGVIQGALFSAFAATVGSSVAFGLAKLDTPLRKKALELVEQYPSLRGIEKVVAKDGIKAVLTLRLAPILPIPIGAYNYVYGVTNVPFLDFAVGIFLGSIKPYLLDSYLGYFGKNILDGTSSESITEDVVLILALCASVLIGVFASQLAGETWESVQQETETEKLSNAQQNGDSLDKDDQGIITNFAGFQFPNFIIDFQKSIQQANEKIIKVVNDEYNAKLWNCTLAEVVMNGHLDPASYADSPELADKGFDIGQSIIESFVFSPVLLAAFIDYADPLHDDYISKGSSSKPECFASRLQGDITGQQEDDVERNTSILRRFRSQLEQKLKDIDEKLS